MYFIYLEMHFLNVVIARYHAYKLSFLFREIYTFKEYSSKIIWKITVRPPPIGTNGRDSVIINNFYARKRIRSHNRICFNTFIFVGWIFKVLCRRFSTDSAIYYNDEYYKAYDVRSRYHFKRNHH